MQLHDIKAKLQELLSAIEAELHAEYVEPNSEYDTSMDIPNDVPGDTPFNFPPENDEYQDNDDEYNDEDIEEFIPPLQSELEMLKRNAGMISAYDDIPSINPTNVKTPHV